PGPPEEAGPHQRRTAGQDAPAVALRERHGGRRTNEAADAEGDGRQAGLQRRAVLADAQTQRKGEKEALPAAGDRGREAEPGRERRDPNQPGAQQWRDTLAGPPVL